MSDQLHKPLTGQYGFTVDADRTATLSNLGFGSTATLAGATVTRLALPTFSDPQTIPIGGAVNLDWSAGRATYLAIDSATRPAITITFANKTDKQFDLFLAITGTPTIAWPTIKWPGGAAPAVPATGKTGWYRFYYNTANTVLFGEGLVTLS